MNAPDTLIVKIQKLLELASRGGTEAEAATAMEMAQKLLAKHNLDLEVVRQAQVAGGTNPIKSKREKTKINRSAMYDWQKELWKALADANFCWHFVTKVREEAGKTREGDQKYTRVKRHIVVGTEENATLVRMMGEYLCDTIERLLPFTANKDRLSRAAISWRAGCAARLVERIHKQRLDRHKADQQAQSDGTGVSNPGTGLAIRLKDVETAEYIANYDFLYGDGAYQRLLDRQKENEARWAAEEAKNTIVVPETPEEMRKRQKREERESAAYWREQARQANRYDRTEFRAGYAEGSNINLNNQVGGGDGKALT